MRKFIAVLALLGAGCTRPPVAEENGIQVSGSQMTAGALVQDVVTKEGVRCVTAFGVHGGGISCDWAHAQPPARSAER